MKDLVTPRQVAQAIDMSESSLKRWCDQGLIPTVRTAGGHRRLPVNGVLTFLRNSGYQLIHPELLGLPPSTTGGKNRKLQIERDRLAQALQAGDEPVCTEVVMNLYLAGISMSTIADDVFTPIFTAIRQQHATDPATCYHERRSCEICHRVLYEVRRAMPELSPTAPVAIGGTLEGDYYTLGSSLAELVLRELGWRSCSLGSSLPFLSLRQAVCDMRPKLVWMNVAEIPSVEAFRSGFHSLKQTALENGITIVCGGKGITSEVEDCLEGVHRLKSFRELENVAKPISPIPNGSPLPGDDGSRLPRPQLMPPAPNLNPSLLNSSLHREI